MYDPGTDAWSPLEDLPTPRSGGGSAVLDGKL
ncbi:MAG TPA: kelch repeat-containing protein [Myxococcaceae bacterium]|nr:kelch repeat-containing protein [Myxococcaceae bacterium]